MSIEGKAKEAAGYVKEELNEHDKSAIRRPHVAPQQAHPTLPRTCP